MLWKTSLSLLLLAAITLAAAPAEGTDLNLFPLHRCWPDCIRPTCCDDYCPKPLPCVPRVRCFGCDDYQGKCAPVVRRLGCFGCDDYCPKCEPAIRCAPRTNLKCVPQSTCRSPRPETRKDKSEDVPAGRE